MSRLQLCNWTFLQNRTHEADDTNAMQQGQ